MIGGLEPNLNSIYIKLRRSIYFSFVKISRNSCIVLFIWKKLYIILEWNCPLLRSLTVRLIFIVVFSFMFWHQNVSACPQESSSEVLGRSSVVDQYLRGLVRSAASTSVKGEALHKLWPTMFVEMVRDCVLETRDTTAYTHTCLNTLSSAKWKGGERWSGKRVERNERMFTPPRKKNNIPAVFLSRFQKHNLLWRLVKCRNLNSRMTRRDRLNEPHLSSAWEIRNDLWW